MPWTLLAQEPLLFYACAFQGLRFRCSAQAHGAARAAVQASLDRHLVAAALLQTTVQRLDDHVQSGQVSGCCTPKALSHVPLLRRAREPALADKLSRYGRQVVDGRKHAELVPMTEG